MRESGRWQVGAVGLVFVLGLACTQILGLDGEHHLARTGSGGGGAASGEPTTGGPGGGGPGGESSTSTTATTGGTGTTPQEQGCWAAGGLPCPVQALSAGAFFTCALLGDGRVKCWGDNNHGQLGLGDTKVRGDEPGEMGAGLPAVDLGGGQKAVAIAAGSLHACAVLGDGGVKCWGYNNYGQLGLGTTESMGNQPGEMGNGLPYVDLGPGPKAIDVAAGGGHSCALLEDGAVKCWGYGGYGQLGIGAEDNRGDEPGEMGASLPAVDLGAGQKAIAISARGIHTCALLAGGTMKCWGANGHGQLGLGDVQDRGDEPGEMGNSLPALVVDSGKPVIAVASCPYMTCGLVKGGGVKCWGQNHRGQLGLGHTKALGDDPDEMVFDLSFVSLGAGQSAVAIAAGFSGFSATGGAHVCAALGSGGLKCWGANDAGQLGLGDKQDRGGGPGEMGNALPLVDLGSGEKITAITAGSEHTCAALGGKAVKCWGLNDVGELGLGDTEGRGDDPGEMGGSLPAVSLE